MLQIFFQKQISATIFYTRISNNWYQNSIPFFLHINHFTPHIIRLRHQHIFKSGPISNVIFSRVLTNSASERLMFSIFTSSTHFPTAYLFTYQLKLPYSFPRPSTNKYICLLCWKKSKISNLKKGKNGNFLSSRKFHTK